MGATRWRSGSICPANAMRSDPRGGKCGALQLGCSFAISRCIPPHEDLREVVLTVGGPGPRSHALVDLDRRSQMEVRVIEPAECGGQEPKIAVDRADASFRMPDRMPAGKRGKLLVEGPRPRDVIEQGTRLACEAHPEEPLIVAVERPEIVAGKFVEDSTSVIRDGPGRGGGT